VAVRRARRAFDKAQDDGGGRACDDCRRMVLREFAEHGAFVCAQDDPALGRAVHLSSNRRASRTKRPP
jgi:hypothetical protein